MERTNRLAPEPGPLGLILFLLALVMSFPASGQQLTSPPPGASSELDTLVREAMERNPSVVAARNHWEALRHVPTQMRTLPDPQIQLQEFTVGSPKPAAGYETSDFYYTGLGVSQDIPGPGKLRLQAEIAEQDAEIGHHQYEAAQRLAAEKVREAYFELSYLTQTLSLLERSRGELLQAERIAQTGYRLGLTEAQDVLKAQLEATQMLNEIEHHHRAMRQRQAELKAELGRDLDSPDIVVREIEPTQIGLSETRLARAVQENSTDLMVAQAMQERSEKALVLARKSYIPDFTLGYSYEKTGPGFRDYYMLTIGARVPLYFWRKQTPAIEQAALDLAAAQSRTRAEELNSLASAKEQLVTIEASARVLRIYRQGLIPQAEGSLQAALAAYRVAKVDFQTVISAFVDLLNLQQSYYRELADHEIAVARLKQIIGEVQ